MAREPAIGTSTTGSVALTAITSQPRRALFANNVTGSVGPLLPSNRLVLVESSGESRSLRSQGCARIILGAGNGGSADEATRARDADAEPDAEAAILRVLQRWIDAPSSRRQCAHVERGEKLTQRGQQDGAGL